MTSRILGAGLLLVLGLVQAVPVQAGCVEEVFESIARDVKRRNCWPKPFIYPDRQATREPFAIMVSNGWERQNMLGGHHFEMGGAQLSEAGRMKVNWIINEAPEQHRTIYVHRGVNAAETAARMAAVQQQMAQFAESVPLPAVLVTGRPEVFTSGDNVVKVNDSFGKAAPEPKLPPVSSSPGGGK